MISAARRTFGPKQIEAKYNPDLSEIELFEIKAVVEKVENPDTEIDLAEAHATLDPAAQIGDELLSKLPVEAFGRIAAQVAKQSIVQRVRDLIYNEFKNRKGEVFSGIVQRVERKNIIVNLGRTDALLPEREQIPWERYRQGDRIRAYILDVEMIHRGPQIVLSRTHPGFLIKLFEQEVPEIYEGIVEVKGAAREPGGRAKIAVYSTDSDVDPVGACVGMKGIRVQAVVQELRGERIDIVSWTADPAEYVCRALAPAKVSKIILDEEEHSMEVIVPDDQLALAIGKRGQNIRLAGRLTVWKLDVVGEAEAEAKHSQALASLTAIPGVGDLTAELFYQSGFRSAEDIAAADVDTLTEVEGIGQDRAVLILEAAKTQVAAKQEEDKIVAAKQEEDKIVAAKQEEDKIAAAEQEEGEPEEGKSLAAEEPSQE